MSRNPSLPAKPQAGPTHQTGYAPPSGSAPPMPYAQPFAWPQMPMMPAYPAYPYMAPQAYSYPQYGYNAAMAPTQSPYMLQTQQSYGYGYQPQPQAPTHTHMQPVEPPNKRARYSQTDTHIPFHSTQNDPKAWRNCSQDGCQFVGPGNEVALHEQDRHLIYPEGYVPERSEEEEAYLRKGGPPPAVFGTSIKLHTEEDIAKWIADRKARFPSKKRLEEKEQERQEAIARGENPDAKRGGKAGRGRRAAPAAQAEDWGRPDPEPMMSDRGRGRGRGGGRGMDVQRGRGRGRDAGWGGRTADAFETAEAVEAGHGSVTAAEAKPPVKPKKAADDSGDDDSNASSSASSSSDSDTDSSSDSEADEVEPEAPAESSKPKSAPAKPICRFFASTGKCKFGDKCRLAHTDAKGDSIHVTGPTPASSGAAPKKAQPQPPKERPNQFARPSMLAQLLSVPINNTLSQLTQTIRFLVANDMLENVELKPGDAEEESRRRALVQEVGTGTGAGAGSADGPADAGAEAQDDMPDAEAA